MNTVGKHAWCLCMLFMIFALCVISGAELNTEQAITCMCSAPSALPEEEATASLPGGFFSAFESKHGLVYPTDGNALPQAVDDVFLYKAQHEALGNVVMVLDQLTYESPYVYATEGVVKVLMDGTEQILSMDRIDYVCDAQDARCYRLACTPQSGCDGNMDRAYILCYDCNEDQSVLAGSIAYFSEGGVLQASYPFFITGRSELEAERHLQKRITFATAY